LHSYAWDADGKAITMDGVGATYDALDRMVEQNRSGSYTQIVYAPTGSKLALMNAQSLQKAFVPLPGMGTAVYTASGLAYYRHADWLGSSRFASTPGRTMYSDAAYSPFGEPYAQAGTSDLSFTGENQDTVPGLYDFPFREYATQGRWPSPDPAGLAAVSLNDPRTWNRYAYVLNDPLARWDDGMSSDDWSDWGWGFGGFGGFGDIGGLGGVGWLSGIWVPAPRPGPFFFQDLDRLFANGCVPDGDLMTFATGFICQEDGGRGASGGNSSGFTLGIRAPGQTFNQCLVANAKNYSAGGVFALSTNTDLGTGFVGQLVGGNTFTSLYAGLAGSAEDAVGVAGTSSPDLLNSAIGSTTTFGRRTSNILSLNLAGKGGLPQALSSSSGGLKSFLGSASKAFNLGLDASLKAAGDLGLFGAEIIGCSIHR